MRFRLRTLLILMALVPPILWGIFSFFRLPGTRYWTVIFLLAFVVCFPAIFFRIYIATKMR